ncbi:MAG: hypothetical protein QXW84_08015 [Archaeoglobaceae archaeon]
MNMLRNKAKASETIENGLVGDCDDYAILMSALVLSIGLSPRIVIVEGHAYPELYLGKDDYCQEMVKSLANKFRDTIYYYKDSDGKCWLSLDWTSSHIGGKPLSDKRKMVIYPDGSYKIYKN